MAKELKLKAGSKIPAGATLYEGYEPGENHITANVGIDKIEGVLQHFIAMHKEPIFFILELPTALDDEKEIAAGDVKKLHEDVYYMDGCSQEEALTVLGSVGDLLYNDGLASFGFGGHESGDEVMFGKYNVLTIYSRSIEKYESFFDAHEIEKTNDLMTAWSVFSEENPGISERYEADGRTVFDIPKQFEAWGMYFAERREAD